MAGYVPEHTQIADTNFPNSLRLRGKQGPALQPQVHHDRAHTPGCTNLALAAIIAFPAQAWTHGRHGHRPSPVWSAVGHGRLVAIHQGAPKKR
jgi:hypothetical protein